MIINDEKLKKAEYPIIEPNSKGKPLKDRIIWKNLFKIRFTDLIFIICIILLLISFKIYTYETNKILKNPCKFAVMMNCSEINITIEREMLLKEYQNKNEEQSFSLPDSFFKKDG